MNIKWAQIADNYIGKPYELCGWGNPGYDCFSVLVSIMRESGVNIPHESKWKGVPLSNYSSLWNEDKIKAKQFIRGFLNKHLIKHNNQIQQGDILLLTCCNEDISNAFLGVHISNRIISAIKQKGVVAFPTKYFKIHDKYKVNYEVS